MITSPMSAGFDAGARDRLADHDRAEIDGRQVLEDAAERPDRGPAGAQDPTASSTVCS